MAPEIIFKENAKYCVFQTIICNIWRYLFGFEISNIVFFKINLNTFVFPFPYCRKAVHGVSGKSADAFGDDEVNLSGSAVLHHPVKIITVFCTRPGNAVIPINGAILIQCNDSFLGGADFAPPIFQRCIPDK